MLPKLLHAFLIIFFSLCISCSETSPRFSPLASDATIMAFGDSLTAGNGAHKEKSYPAMLQQMTGYKVINAGISGEESDRGLKRLPALLKKHQPALVIICHGGNDILRKRNLSQTQSNIIKMIELAKSQQANVMLLGVPKPSLILSALPVYQHIADQTRVIYDPSTMASVLAKRELKSDTYHPNAAGYAVIAEKIFQQLIESGLIKTDS